MSNYKDLLRFSPYLNEKPPITAKSYITAVKEFLAENGIEFSQRSFQCRISPQDPRRSPYRDTPAESCEWLLSFKALERQKLPERQWKQFEASPLNEVADFVRDYQLQSSRRVKIVEDGERISELVDEKMKGR